MKDSDRLSIIIPSKDEADSLKILLPAIRQKFSKAELIIVDDGSSDNTAAVVEQNGAIIVKHPYNIGNGGAVKSGARAATGDILVFMDADGQHNPEDIKPLLEKLDEGFDMVVGSRSMSGQANVGRGLANTLYNMFASYMVGQKIEDLTSGFRAVNAEKFRQFLYLLPNGFSYPTTITMAFFRAGYKVAYHSIHVQQRMGKSHIRPLKDGVRFALIIFRVGTLYSPLKLFLPLSFFHFVIGFSYYLYTYITQGRFTNMSALLFITSILIFLIGLVSEQISSLHYRNSNR